MGPAAGNGPGAFKVELKNGLIYEYGTTADSQILSLGQDEARAWALSRISDRSGNEITFTWHDDTVNGSYRIDYIDYADNTIVFQWESKPGGEVRSGFVTGSQVREIHRLQAIEVQQGGAVLRRYDLTYEGPLSATSRSRLASMQECAGFGLPRPDDVRLSGRHCRPAGRSRTPARPCRPAPCRSTSMATAARTSCLYRAPLSGSGTWRVMLANTSGGYGTPTTACSRTELHGRDPDSTTTTMGWATCSSRTDNTTWQVMLGSASGLGPLTNTGAPATPMAAARNARGLDINGDGRDDLVWADISRLGWPGDAISYRLRNTLGNGF